MNNLIKSLSRAAIVFAGGVGVWLAIVAMAGQSSKGLSPALWVMLMGLYIIAYGVAAFWTHKQSIVGVKVADGRRTRRRPSFVIPVITTITLMIFIVAHSENNPVIWAMG